MVGVESSLERARVFAALADAFRWHRAIMRADTFGPGRKPSDVRNYALRPYAMNTRANHALELARADVAAGKARYPSKGKPAPAVTWQPVAEGLPQSLCSERLAYVEKPANAGLREVGAVNADESRSGLWASGRAHEPFGWYADSDYGNTNGTVHGMVYQLQGRDGEARFVAGYRFTEHDGEGVTIDFGTIYAESTTYEEKTRLYGSSRWYQDSPCDMDSACDAARVADGMAKRAAEDERDYSNAWQAGARWRDLGEEIVTTRADVVALLGERREAQRQLGAGAFAQVRGAIRSQVSTMLETIAEAREERAKLAAGDYVSEWLPGFWHGDKRLRSAFCDGANLEAFPD